MTDKLPPNLLALFAPRPPLRWVPPSDYPAEERKTANPSGVAGFLDALKEYKDKDNYVPTESWLQARDRKTLEKKAALEKLMAEVPSSYKPADDPNVRGDAFKTLIVCRLSYQATEEDLEREFGRIGNIERIRIVRDTHADEHPNKKKKAHRGYAFIVFEREKDMRAALEQLQGISLHGRRVKLDVERGRTVPGWRPRRLGGGLGGRGYTQAATMRPNGFGPPGGFDGGFRGGFRGGRGGFRGGDRGGFRGGFDRGPRGGGGAFGARDRGFGGPPNAPSGPGSASGSTYGGRSDRDRNDYRGGGGFGRRDDDRSGGGYRGGGGGGGGGFDRSGSGSNNEPLGSRDRDRGDRGGGYRDRGHDDRRGGYDDRRGDDRRGDDSRKRPYEGGSGYEGERKLRRY